MLGFWDNQVVSELARTSVLRCVENSKVQTFFINSKIRSKEEQEEEKEEEEEEILYNHPKMKNILELEKREYGIFPLSSVFSNCIKYVWSYIMSL